MEKNVGIWLDSEKAYIISLMSDGKEDIKIIESNVENRLRYPGESKSYSKIGSMFINPQKKATKRKKQQLHYYFQDIIHNITDVNKLIVFGPSDTKKHLAKEIKSDKKLSDRLISIESEDNISQNQMVAKVKDFFKA